MSAYLRRMAYHACLRVINANKTKWLRLVETDVGNSQSSEILPPDTVAEREKRQAHVRRCLDTLPWKQRYVLVEYYVKGISLAQIRRKKGWKTSTLHKRAFARMKRCLEKYINREGEEQ